MKTWLAENRCKLNIEGTRVVDGMKSQEKFWQHVNPLKREYIEK